MEIIGDVYMVVLGVLEVRDDYVIRVLNMGFDMILEVCYVINFVLGKCI